MASSVKSAVPSHLKSSLAVGNTGGSNGEDAEFQRHHGKTRSHMVSLPYFFAFCFPARPFCLHANASTTPTMTTTTTTGMTMECGSQHLWLVSYPTTAAGMSHSTHQTLLARTEPSEARQCAASTPVTAPKSRGVQAEC